MSFEIYSILKFKQGRFFFFPTSARLSQWDSVSETQSASLGSGTLGSAARSHEVSLSAATERRSEITYCSSDVGHFNPRRRSARRLLSSTATKPQRFLSDGAWSWQPIPALRLAGGLFYSELFWNFSLVLDSWTCRILQSDWLVQSWVGPSSNCSGREEREWNLVVVVKQSRRWSASSSACTTWIVGFLLSAGNSCLFLSLFLCCSLETSCKAWSYIFFFLCWV